MLCLSVPMNQSGHQIRYLTPEDIDALHTLWRSAGLSVRDRGRDSRESLTREMQSHPRNFIGLFIDERLVGSVLATGDGRKGWINRVAVDPSHRRQGLALRLIEEAEQELKQRGITVIALLIEPGNDPSRRLFERAGYKDFPGIIYMSKRDSAES